MHILSYRYAEDSLGRHWAAYLTITPTYNPRAQLVEAILPQTIPQFLPLNKKLGLLNSVTSFPPDPTNSAPPSPNLSLFLYMFPPIPPDPTKSAPPPLLKYLSISQYVSAYPT